MIKFNHYPPQKPGDIELTPGAVRLLTEASEKFEYEKLSAYGAAISNMLSTVTVGHYEIKKPVLERAEEVIRMANEPLAFEASFTFGLGALVGAATLEEIEGRAPAINLRRMYNKL